MDFEYPPAWNGTPDDQELWELLVKAGCPIVCIGVRDPDGEDWHATCEARADEALFVLRGWAVPIG